MSRPAGLLEAPGQRLDRAERARLRAVARYVVLGTPPEAEFDDLAEMAALVTGCRYAAIAFADAHHVWTKSAYGFSSPKIPREASFASAAFGLGANVVPDTFADSRCAAVTWVHDEPFASSCATAPLITPDGFTLGHLVVMDGAPCDLDARRRAALAVLARQVMALLELRRTLLCYHTVIDGAGLVVFHTDPTGHLVSLTPTWAKLTGQGVVRSLGNELHAHVCEDDRAKVRSALRDVLENQRAVRMDCRVASAAGTDVPAELFAQPLPLGDGLPAGVVGVIADITERRSREIADQHRQKLESLGRLATGVAHEINTPIQFVGDNARYLGDVYQQMLHALDSYQRILQTSAPAEEKIRALTEVAAGIDLGDINAEVPSAVLQTLDGVDRVATIVHAMKAMSHPGHDHQAAADLNEAILATVAIARNELKYDADIVLDLKPLPAAQCFIADLGQVFLNLLINAADAIRESARRGSVTVATDHDGKWITIRISDTGVGIPAHLLSKIFDPFFTTKAVGRGTGQGLALAHAVVYGRHGGSIDVDSTPGSGTTFIVRIPIAGTPEGPQ